MYYFLINADKAGQDLGSATEVPDKITFDLGAKCKDRMNLEPALILALTKIQPEIRCCYARNKLSYLI
jgi:hypothetical protein